MSLRTAEAAAVAAIVGVAGVGLALWPRLPAELAVHFDAGGTPDNYVPKAVGVVLAPAIGLAAIAVVRLAVRADPTADRRVAAAAVVFLGGVIAYVQALVLTYNLGYRYSMSLALLPVGLAALALVVYAFRREGVG